MPDRQLMTADEFRAAARKGKTPDEAVVVKQYASEIKTEEIKGRKIPFVISTNDVDRDGDVVSVDGWDLKNYQKNPVVLWAHDYRRLPVGRGHDVKVDGGSLRAVAEFAAKEVSEFADEVYRMVVGKFLSAVSVGFVPRKWAFSEENGRQFGIDFLEQELLEFSVVPVPANPNALVSLAASGGDCRLIREWASEALKGISPAPYQIGITVDADNEAFAKAVAEVIKRIGGNGENSEPPVAVPPMPIFEHLRRELEVIRARG